MSLCTDFCTVLERAKVVELGNVRQTSTDYQSLHFQEGKKRSSSEDVVSCRLKQSLCKAKQREDVSEKNIFVCEVKSILRYVFLNRMYNCYCFYSSFFKCQVDTSKAVKVNLYTLHVKDQNYFTKKNAWTCFVRDQREEVQFRILVTFIFRHALSVCSEYFCVFIVSGLTPCETLV